MSANGIEYPIKWHKISYGYDKDMNHIRERESFVYITEKGAVEGWRTPSAGDNFGREYYGGVEIHSKTQLYGFKAEPSHEYCQWTNGKCWDDGSSLAFYDIENFFDNPTLMFVELGARARDWFEEDESLEEGE